MRHGWTAVAEAGPDLLEQAWALIHAGDARTAMDILNATTGEANENRQSIMEDEEGEMLGFVQNRLVGLHG